MGANTKANTLGSWFERWAAYLRDCSVELPLRPSAIAAPPSGPRRLSSRLREWGLEVSGEPCQWALTERRTLAGRHAHLSDVSAAAQGSNLLSTIAPGTPTPLAFRLSSVMLFSRKETSGIPQKSVRAACSSTTLARVSAASPVT